MIFEIPLGVLKSLPLYTHIYTRLYTYISRYYRGICIHYHYIHIHIHIYIGRKRDRDWDLAREKGVRVYQ